MRTSLAPGIRNFGDVVVGASAVVGAGAGVGAVGVVAVNVDGRVRFGCDGFGVTAGAGAGVVAGAGAAAVTGAGAAAFDFKCLWVEQNLNHPPFQRLVAVLVHPGA